MFSRTPSSLDDRDDGGIYNVADDLNEKVILSRSSSSSPPSQRPASRVKVQSHRRPASDLKQVYPTTARLVAENRDLFADGEHGIDALSLDHLDDGDIADFLWQQRRPQERDQVMNLSDSHVVQNDAKPTLLTNQGQSNQRPSRVGSASPAAHLSAAPLSAALVPVDGSGTLQALIAENDELKEKIEKLKKELKEKDIQMQSLKLDAAMREAEVGDINSIRLDASR